MGKKFLFAIILLIASVVNVLAQDYDYLCFTAEEAGSTVGIKTYSGKAPDVQYSFDKQEWFPMLSAESIILMQKGDMVFFRGINPNGFSYYQYAWYSGTWSHYHYTSFVMSGSISASGSIMSLIDGTGEITTIPNSYCFYDLFYGCSALSRAPKLTATSLSSHCYDEMFMYCSNLSSISVDFDSWDSGSYTSNWLYGVSDKGTFVGPKDLSPISGSSYVPSGWSVYDDGGDNSDNDYLVFTAQKDNSKFGIYAYNTSYMANVMYSYDKKNWYIMSHNTYYSLNNEGDSVFIKGFNPNGFSTAYNRYTYFMMIGSISASGNVMSLIDGKGLTDSIPCGYCFYGLFSGCSALTSAPKFPATQLTSECYYYAFNGCTNLTESPELPATKLASYCYEWMFCGCKKLVKAPYLPASSLQYGCYNYMFYNCSKLDSLSVNFSNWNDGAYTSNWLSGVAPQGVFIGPDNLDIKTGSSYIPTGWCVVDDEADNPEYNYLKFTANEDNSSVGVYTYNGNEPDVQYSFDKIRWYKLTSTKVTIQSNTDTMYVRGFNPNGFSTSSSYYTYFTMSGSVSAHGSVMSLIDGKGITDTIPNDYCFYWLFKNCYSLTQAPELTATSLTSSCYRLMFDYCTSLVDAPVLPVEELKSYCYASMFRGCSSLENVPALRSIEMALGCYYQMFRGCSNLKKAPKLPALRLANDCYNSMFYGCVSIEEAPYLPADSLVYNCYYQMFYNCSNLDSVSVNFSKWNDGDNSTYDWLYGVATKGTFVGPNDLSPIAGTSYIPEGWMIYDEDGDNPENDYLTFVANEDNSSFGIYANYSSYMAHVMYSFDKKNWHIMSNYVNYTLANAGDSVFVRGGNTSGFSTSSSYWTKFVMQGSISTSGSVMSLIDGKGLSDSIPSQYCFYNLFSGCTALTSAPKLPATKLKNYCYRSMFYDCANLQEAPELPATSLSEYCYRYMFYGCNKISKAPYLPARNLKTGCYYCMFYNCSNLDSISVNFSKWNYDNSCTTDWLYGVATKGTFVGPNELSPIAGTSYIPEGWIVYDEDGDNSENDYLVFVANEDNSTFGISANYSSYMANVMYSFDKKNWRIMLNNTNYTLANAGDSVFVRGGNTSGFSTSSSYYTKFVLSGSISACGNVMSMIDGKGITDSIPNQYCFYNLFNGCTALTSAPKLPATKLKNYCYNSMFYGCTGLTEAPELPATELPGSCYSYMFYDCNNLSTSPELPATSLGEYCYGHMFYGCSKISKAPYLPARILKPGCYNQMFYNCSMLDSVCVNFKNWSINSELCTSDWLYGVAGKGTFVCSDSLMAKAGSSYIPNGWLIYDEDGDNPENDYLTFVADQDNSKFGIYCNYSSYIASVMYSFDKKNWQVMSHNTYYTLKNVGDSVYLRGVNLNGFSSSSYPTRFVMSGSISASGNVMSLVDGKGLATEIPSDYCFYNLFYDCSSLTSAPKLPAIVLKSYCYSNMFNGCSQLVEAPDLPAQTLATYCYDNMFYGCSNLRKAPYLSASQLKTGCYQDMFYNCSNLNEVNVEFTSWNSASYTSNWLYGVATYGTFYKPESLSLSTGSGYIPYSWVVYDVDSAAINPDYNYLTFKANEEGSSITFNTKYGTAPNLYWSSDKIHWRKWYSNSTVDLSHADDVIFVRGNNPSWFSYSDNYYSYFSMTGSISASGSVMSLLDKKGISTTIPYNYCFYQLFKGCSALTTAPELPATTLTSFCYYSMFENCTNIERAPHLPAEKLYEDCYKYMFYNCSKLNYISVEFADWYREVYVDDGWYYGGGFYRYYANTSLWVSGVAKTGSFVCPSGLSKSMGSSYIPDGWIPNPCNVYADSSSVDYVLLTNNLASVGGTFEFSVLDRTSDCYRIKSLCVVGSDGDTVSVQSTDTDVYSFTMPACDVTIAVEYESVDYDIDDVLDKSSDYTCTGSYVLEARLPKNATGRWSADSSVAFADVTSGNTEVANLKYGSNILTWNVDLYGCKKSKDFNLVNSSVYALLPFDEAVTCDGNLSVSVDTPKNGIGYWSCIGSNDYYINVQNSTKDISVYGIDSQTKLIWKVVSDDNRCESADTIVVENRYQHKPDADVRIVANERHICSSAFELDASSQDDVYGYWTSDGNVIFEDVHSPNTRIENLNSDGAMLVWTLDNGYCSNSDTLFVYNNRVSANIINDDKVYCLGSTSTSVLISAEKSGYGTGTWSIDNGSFTVVSDSRVRVSSSVNDVYRLRWDVVNNHCSASDSVEIVFLKYEPVAPSSINADCDYTAVLSAEKYEDPYGTYGYWSTYYKDVDIADPMASETVVSNLRYGTTKFQWHLSGVCGDKSVDVTVVNHSVSPLEKLEDIVIKSSYVDLKAPRCENFSQTGQWILLSENANVSIANPNSNYTTASNLSMGTYDFRWTVTDGECSQSTDLRVYSKRYVDLWSNAQNVSVRNLPRRALTGDTIRFSVIPDDGYFLDNVTINGNGVAKDWSEISYILDSEKFVLDAETTDITRTLNFSADNGNADFSVVNLGTNKPNVEYTIDRMNWIPLEGKVSISDGEKIYFRGYNVSGFSHSENDYTSFVINGNVKADGNVMSLVNRVGAGASVPNDYCFYRLFGDCEGLLTPPELSATTLSNYCYARMFENCKSLSYCPNLPAQETKDYCYYNMFFGCESLLGKPDLPKDNLAQSCYGYMFYGCPNIKEYWDDIDDNKPDNSDEIYVGVGDLDIVTNKSWVSVYPNPACAFEAVTIKVDNLVSQSSSIMIFDANGVKVLEIAHAEEINKVYLPTGVYVGVLVNGAERKSFKVMVR